MSDRVALLSDIHGEQAALAAVLAEMEEEGIERCWCLGDSVEWLLPREPSRRGDPGALREMLTRCEHVLAGNHEQEMLADPAGRARIAAEPDDENLAAGGSAPFAPTT